MRAAADGQRAAVARHFAGGEPVTDLGDSTGFEAAVSKGRF
jgi:hypothetical protein